MLESDRLEMEAPSHRNLEEDIANFDLDALIGESDAMSTALAPAPAMSTALATADERHLTGDLPPCTCLASWSHSWCDNTMGAGAVLHGCNVINGSATPCDPAADASAWCILKEANCTGPVQIAQPHGTPWMYCTAESPVMSSTIIFD